MKTLLMLCVLAALGAACDSEESNVPGGGGSGGAGGQARDCAIGEAVVEGACVQAGATACASGFAADARGGCTPILPTRACSPGLVALPGMTACAPIADCGEGRWGDIPVDDQTLYVDAASSRPGTGSIAAPFPTVAAALAVAPPHALVAIAEGTYGEALTITAPVRLHGRCPAMVAVVGDGNLPGLFIQADEVDVRGLAIAPADVGVFVIGNDVVLDRVWIHDTPDAGIAVIAPSVVHLTNSLIERVSGLGAVVIGSEMTIERSVIRDLAGNGLAPGRGLSVERDDDTRRPSHVTLRSSVIDRAVESGIGVLQSSIEIDASVIINTQPQSDGRFGIGVAVQGLMGEADAVIRDSYVGNNLTFGVSVLEASVIVDRTTITDVRPQSSSGGFGDGIAVFAGVDEEASIRVTASRIAGAARAGIASFNALVELNSVALECNAIHLNGEALGGEFFFDDRGGNACWCETAVATCQVLSANLQPPGGV